MLTYKYLLVFLALVGATSGSLSTGKAFVPRSPVVKKQLAVRAGAGPVNKDLAGKLLTGAYLIQGTLLMIAPAQQFKFYGMEGTDDISKALCSDFGSDFVATGIVAYRSLVEKTTANKAIGSAFLFLLAWTIVTLLTGRQGSIGASLEPIYARLVIFALGSLTALTDQEYASKLAFANIYFRLVNGIFTVFDPVKVGETWGLQLADHAANRFCMRALGFSITWCSTVMITLLGGLEALKSLACGSLVFTSYLITQRFINKEWLEVGMPVGKGYAWMIFLSILSGIILL